MKRIVVLLAFFLLCVPFRMHAQFPTDSARFYLVTASPGEQTYAIFGHSALRVNDPVQGYDVVFNWGTFDFDTENFYLKFGTGSLMYFLSVSDYSRFLPSYQWNGQAIYLQEIHLTNFEKFRLVNNLQINVQEENKYFRYDFFRDNCATRIRDIMANSVDGKIVFDSLYVPKRESFRTLFGHYLENEPWTFFGLNLIMGKSTDSIASIHDYMYLPGHLQNLFTTAVVVGNNGETRKLTSEPVEIFPATIESKKPSFLVSPVFVCTIFFLIILLITFIEIRKGKHFRILDIVLFSITGLLGILITWLWGWSLHIYVHHNLHIIWASPLNLFAAVCLIFCRTARLIRYYFAVYAISVLMLIVASFFTAQAIPAASYFLMGAMMVRAAGLFFQRKTGKLNKG